MTKSMEFEKYPKLVPHMLRMASTGNAGNLIEWNEFIKDLNDTLKSVSNEKDEEIERLKGAGHSCGVKLLEATKKIADKDEKILNCRNILMGIVPRNCEHTDIEDCLVALGFTKNGF